MSMRHRQSSSVSAAAVEGDEETGASAPSPESLANIRSRRRGKAKQSSTIARRIRRRFDAFLSLSWSKSNAPLSVLLLMMAMTLLLLTIRSRNSASPATKLPATIRTPLFVPQVGSRSTRCQSVLRKNDDDEEGEDDDGRNDIGSSKSMLLSRHKLDKSLALGTTFLLQHQRPQGNFDYEYNWRTGTNLDEDQEVRQAGALWGFSLIFHDAMENYVANYESSSTTAAAAAIAGMKTLVGRIQRGLEFFEANSRLLYNSDDGSVSSSTSSSVSLPAMRYLTYPDETKHDTGTQALVVLALVDFLRALTSVEEISMVGLTVSQVEYYWTLLDELLPFLVTQHAQVMKTKGKQATTSSSDRFEAYQDLMESGVALKQGQQGLWTDQGRAVEMRNWWKTNVERYSTGGESYFFDHYNEHGKRTGKSSPYYDGESLLAIIKAAKYLGGRYLFLWPVATGTAMAMHQQHVVKALKEDEDSDETKGCYQWLSMSLFELASVTFGPTSSSSSSLGTFFSSLLGGRSDQAKFDLPLAIEPVYPQDAFGRWLLQMALWMVQTHHVLRKTRNTGYAYEGLTHAFAWASHLVSTQQDVHDASTTAQTLECTFEKGLTKLMSWQVGMGNAEKADEDWDGVQGLGGVQNAKDEPGLRIDVTQHQMHATILARRYVYPPNSGSVGHGGESSLWPWEAVVLPQD